jgi:hypothetical protein
MIYRNGKKIKAIFRNGKAISKIFRDGKLVWQKAKPEAKRVKSIKVSLPLWGTVERIEWESILRAVPSDINGYYLDVTINGLGVRLRGAGGRYTGVLSDNVIELPSSMFITTDELYAGMELTFDSKLPSVTSEPTYKKSNSSYKKDAFYQFENAPFVNGSVFKANVTGSVLQKPKWELKANLTGVLTGIAPASTITGSIIGGLWMEYKHKAFETMARFGTDTWMVLKPSFHIKLSPSGKISKPTLVSPACNLTHRMKIISVETY